MGPWGSPTTPNILYRPSRLLPLRPWCCFWSWRRHSGALLLTCKQGMLSRVGMCVHVCVHMSWGLCTCGCYTWLGHVHMHVGTHMPITLRYWGQGLMQRLLRKHPEELSVDIIRAEGKVLTTFPNLESMKPIILPPPLGVSEPRVGPPPYEREKKGGGVYGTHSEAGR